MTDWAALPPEVVLQIHWRRTPEFQAKLNEHGFHVVTVARHPLDVLISILHFCIYESESEQWLLGERRLGSGDLLRDAAKPGVHRVRERPARRGAARGHARLVGPA